MVPINTIKRIWITFLKLDKLHSAEVKSMKQNQKAGTDAQKVKKQNQKSQQAQPGQYGTEFAEETDAQQVKKQNKQSQQNKHNQ